MKKRLWVILTLVSVVLLLSGCTEFDQPISGESQGFWNEFIVWPLVSVIKYFADLLGTYAWGIIVVTIIIRLAILPLTLKQIKSSKKMQEIQPKMKELQAKYSSKDAVTQQKYQQEIETKANKILSLVKRGYTNLVFTNIIEIEKRILKIIELKKVDNTK